MRKVIGILLMIIVIGVFSWFTIQKVTANGESFSISNLFNKNKEKEEKTLEELAIEVDTNYPNQVKEVMELYNHLLNLYYKEKVTDEQIETYAKATRKMYSDELNRLNPIEKQVEALKEEDRGQFVTSQIQDVYIQKDKEDKDVRAEVVVVYATNNKTSFMRNYSFIKENNNWKINSWKDYPIEEEQAQ